MSDHDDRSRHRDPAAAAPLLSTAPAERGRVTSTSSRTFVVAGLLGTPLGVPCSAPLHASVGQLDLTLLDGATSITLPMGGAFLARVSLHGEDLLYNAALWRLEFGVEGCQVLTYSWQAPFVTGGATDFSLGGLPLPLLVDEATLQGPGLPPDVIDVEFGNVSVLFDAAEGPLMDLFLRVPLEARPGSTFTVRAIPDLFTDGFLVIPVIQGLSISVSIVDSDVFGDLSGDGVVNSNDLGLLLSNWGGVGLGDLNDDGTVDSKDLGLLLGAWTA